MSEKALRYTTELRPFQEIETKKRGRESLLIASFPSGAHRLDRSGAW